MAKLIPFYKMHGLGNDFVIINSIQHPIDPTPSFIQKIADRHLGIGFDQLLLLTTSNKADFACLIFNADGSQAMQCGNGIRCLSRFIKEMGFVRTNTLTIETKSCITHIHIENFDQIKVSMGTPIFEPKEIPFLTDTVKSLYELPMPDETLYFSVVSLGNPHALIKVNDLAHFPIETVTHHLIDTGWFPDGVNVGCFEIENPHRIRLRTRERGVGETFACGSNACAAVAAGILHGWLKTGTIVQLKYGDLTIHWQGKGHTIEMEGPASRVFIGSFNEDDFQE